MADNTRVNDLQDKLLKAMDILNAQALNSISFDKTITCKIENDKDKKEGKYEVNDGNRIFTAYSNDTRLRSGDTVYVTVPEGNFENQKMIIGKKTADNDKPFNFTQPFDTFFDMTGNIITPDEIKEENKELIANSVEDEDALIENCKTSTWLIGSKDTNGDIVMTDVSNKDLIKYTRLAVRADFRTWIKNAVRGEYGINIYLRTSKPKTVSAENHATENNEQTIEQGDYEYNWNNSMMYGNTYNFETYYSQEIVLDLEKQDIGRVDGIAIEFYQKANFYDKFNEPIPSSEGGFITYNNNLYDRFDINGGTDNGYYQQQGNPLSPNIFIDNFYLSFGYDISTFTDDYVEIYTQNRNSYRRSTEVGNDYTKENQKEIKMRWVHLKDGNPIDMVVAAGKQSGETEPNYEVRWYRYLVGAAAADQFCGIYWIEEKRGDFNLIFNPDVNKQQEKIKAIVLCDGIPYRSNELIFENEEDLPPSKEAQHIMTALTITTKDDSNGNYMIYGQDNSIKDTTYSKETRKLEAWFDVNSNGEIDYSENSNEKINDITNLKWIFPEKNTMIQLINGDKTGEIDENGNEILSQITATGRLPEYKIKSYYSPSYSNNTIQCQYTLNGVVYTTEKEFTFGPAGTMGTDQTLVIDFVGDINAIDINDINLKHQLQVQLYDNQNKLVTDFQNATIEWSFYYQSDDKLILTPNNEDKTKVDLTFGEGFNINSLYIAKVKIGKLETYFPLPIKDGYSYIKGPTQVIYQADGEPAYNREEYKLYNSMDKNVNVDSWSVTINDKYCGTINVYNKLCPLSIYVKDAPVYGVQAKIGNKIVWTQPILVLQNQWPNGVINAWDGESLKLDYETQTVLAAAISAGKKNSEDNTFSGVMMGDWGAQDVAGEIASQTGLYGFHHGAMSYAFKEDGTAFIGKSSMARINFDGSNATIYSSGYNQKNSAGMMIDLYGGGIKPYIKLKSANGNSIMELSTEDRGSEITMTGSNTYGTGNNKITKSGTICITNKESYKPLSIGDNFDVDWNGEIRASGGSIGNWNILSSGALQSNDQKITLNTQAAGSVQIGNGINSKIIIQANDGTNDTGQIKIGNNATLGYVKANTTGWGAKDGVGLIYNDTAIIQTTSSNSALKYGNQYITVESNNISIGTTNNNQQEIQINGATTYNSQDGNTVLRITHIKPENQYGIYARFA